MFFGTFTLANWKQKRFNPNDNNFMNMGNRESGTAESCSTSWWGGLKPISSFKNVFLSEYERPLTSIQLFIESSISDFFQPRDLTVMPITIAKLTSNILFPVTSVANQVVDSK